MRFFRLVMLVSLMPLLSYARPAQAFFWIFYTGGATGEVVDAADGKPLESVDVEYAIYHGVGDNGRPAFHLFQRVHVTTDNAGKYRLPAVFKPFWLISPTLIPANCLLPGMGLHAGFSVSQVTFYKWGYHPLKLDKADLARLPLLRLWRKNKTSE